MIEREHSPEELLAIRLIQLAQDILDGIIQSRNNNVFNGVHSSIRRPDHVVEDHECRL